MSPWTYYLAAGVLFISNLSGFFLNFAALPGNWLIVASSALFCYFAQSVGGVSLNWYVVGLLCLLAVIGEVLEFAAGTMGAARLGASRRALLLSVVGSIGGSLVGAMFGIPVPVPVLGPALGALVGGAIGAALGAIVGEDWKGRNKRESLRAGAGAFVGRVLGTVGKVAVGATMLVIATVDSIW